MDKVDTYQIPDTKQRFLGAKLPRFNVPNKPRPGVQCVCCLYRIGFGYDRISKIVPFQKRCIGGIVARRGLVGTRTLLIIRKSKPTTKLTKQQRFQNHINNLPNRKRKLRLRTYLWKWLKHSLNPILMPTIVGSSREYVMDYLEAQFTSGMTWGNYGSRWQIDHRIPCSKFDLTDHAQVLRCFHFSNLQPMFTKANKIKSASLVPTQVEFLVSV